MAPWSPVRLLTTFVQPDAVRRWSVTRAPEMRLPVAVASVPLTRWPLAFAVIAVRTAVDDEVADDVAGDDEPDSQLAFALSQTVLSVVSVTPGGSTFLQPPAVA